MSLNAIQRRHPWMMAPLQWINNLLSPGWWACAIGHLSGEPADGATRIARRLTRVIAFDTTALARFLNRVNVLVPMREAILRRVPALRSLDWEIRKYYEIFERYVREY